MKTFSFLKAARCRVLLKVHYPFRPPGFQWLKEINSIKNNHKSFCFSSLLIDVSVLKFEIHVFFLSEVFHLLLFQHRKIIIIIIIITCTFLVLDFDACRIKKNDL